MTKRWVSAFAVLGLTFTLVTLLKGAESSAAPGTALDVPMLAGESGALPAPQWPEGDFADSLLVAEPAAKTAAAPAAPTLVAPDNGVTVATVTPKFSVETVPGDVEYRFVVTSGESPDAGQLATSGWIRDHRWAIPSGTLADGRRYSWTAQVRDARSEQAGPEAEARQLAVNLRLGQQNPAGPIPMDGMQPVSVNLATGNVSTSLMSTFVMTGMGPLAVQFTYNSLLANQSGLVGSYFAGDSRDGISDDEKPAAVRTDSQISFLWGTRGSTPGGIEGDRFRVRWQGYIRVPETGKYTFGGLHRAGMRVQVGDQQVYDGWTRRGASTATYGGGMRLEAGKSYPIQVDYRAAGFPSFVQLWARADSGRATPVPSSWLSPTASILPPGWTMSPDPSAFVTATPTESGMLLTDGGGASTTFTHKQNGEYESSTGAGSVTRDKAGKTTATSPGGVTSVFDADGRLTSVRGGASDAASAATSAGAPAAAPAATPAAAGGQADSAPSASSGPAPARVESTSASAESPHSRMTELTTMDHGSPIHFYYAGSDKCVDDTAPAEHLCAVTLPDGSTSHLSYEDGQFTRLRKPGDEVTDMAYNRNNQLTKIRTPMVMDWIGADVGNRDSDAAAFLIDYDSRTGRAERLESPEPTGMPQRSPQRTTHSYTYGDGSTEMKVAGLRPGQGWAQRVTWDIGGRKLTDTDATGRTTEYVWAPTDQPLSITDPAGRRTTTVAGPSGMATYGPAPKECFNADGTPVDPAPSGCDRMPIERMAPSEAAVTRTTVQSDGVEDQVVAMTMNQAGMPVSEVLDPGGLALETKSSYDENFRKKALTLPTGASITYDYYGMTDTAADPCDPNAEPVPQMGALKSFTAPTPATGEPRVDNFIYDVKGLEAGMNFGTDKWVCGARDARGRETEILTQGDGVHPDRLIEIDWAYGGNPLSIRQEDQYGATTAVLDLLGRPIDHTDVHGVHTETNFDRAGRVVSQTVTPPDSADPAVTVKRGYDDAGRLLRVDHGDKTLSTSRYNAGGELVSVRYANGSELAEIGRDAAGRVTSLDWKLADGERVTSTVTRTRAGTVVDESLGGVDARPDGPNYVYDAAGRLVEAWVLGHHYTYDFTSPSAATCPEGTQPNAGRNGYAVRITDETEDGPATTDFCYDHAGRLLAASGANTVSDVKYSSAAHMAEYTLDGQRIQLSYDVAERYTGVSIEGDDPAKVTYGYDTFDSVTSRTVEGSESDDSKVLYQVNPFGATEVLEMRADKRVLNRTIPLPGGVIASPAGEVAGGGETWRYPNVHGDIAVTSDGEGQLGDLFRYTPYGAPVTPDGEVDPDYVPSNQAGAEYAWFGQHYKRYEHAGGLSLVVQGLRQVDPLMGRYHSVNTVDNTQTAIQYWYPKADPINYMNLNSWDPRPNSSDLTGSQVGPIGGSADPPR